MMQYTVFIDGREIECDLSVIQALQLSSDEVNVGTEGFNNLEGGTLSLDFTVSNKLERKLRRLFKTYEPKKQKLTWRDIPVKGRFNR